jgi:ATP phosphoribosyltransferase regulatory subunit
MVDPFIARDERWLLPEGIEELLPEQAERIERLRRNLLDLFASWGYRLVIPPIIEHLESLLVGTGRDLELQTFKLTDQLTGRLLGVRADMTPQVARIDAHRLKSNAPTRLCYVGPVLHTRPQGFARTRSPFQVGAELYGHGGIESDVEILQLMVETLSVVGLNRPHIDLGHVGVFRGLAREAQLDAGQEQVLFDALQRKAKPEIKAYLDTLTIDPEYRRMLTALMDLNGGSDVLPEARRLLGQAGADVRQALDNLEQIAQLSQRKMPDIALHFDVAELRGYHYQTGVVFAAFVPGHGQEIARGGRYDDIGRAFGGARPATGFSTDLETLIMLSPQQKEQQGAILAPGVDDSALHAAIARLRRQGQRVCMALPGQSGTAQEMGCDRVLEQHDGTWLVKTL